MSADTTAIGIAKTPVPAAVFAGNQVETKLLGVRPRSALPAALIA